MILLKSVYLKVIESRSRSREQKNVLCVTCSRSKFRMAIPGTFSVYTHFFAEDSWSTERFAGLLQFVRIQPREKWKSLTANVINSLRRAAFDRWTLTCAVARCPSVNNQLTRFQLRESLRTTRSHTGANGNLFIARTCLPHSVHLDISHSIHAHYFASHIGSRM